MSRTYTYRRNSYREDTVRTTQDTIEEQENIDNTVEDVIPKRKRRRTLPTDATRRSERHCKAPEKYNEYVMFGMRY
jgi:hypothetical protein